MIRRMRVAAIGLTLTLAMASEAVWAQQHMQSWSVFRNCNVRPCTIGVAVSNWSQPGWSRVASFWNEAWAWKHACWLHHVDRSHHSPDIAAGRIDCRKY
ncbi:MAG: hypothetical protein KJZ80_00685 [Hyphomicrobiaceae bacterium]|nr:hypothetical protein [Hyphomicrobiaceae bacterium]